MLLAKGSRGGRGVSHAWLTVSGWGFYTALWQAKPSTAPLGALTSAGYLELFSHGSYLDTLRTFLLLCDPLTLARIFVSQHLYLPLFAHP